MDRLLNPLQCSCTSSSSILDCPPDENRRLPKRAVAAHYSYRTRNDRGPGKSLMDRLLNPLQCSCTSSSSFLDCPPDENRRLPKRAVAAHYSYRTRNDRGPGKSLMDRPLNPL